jgi:PadR family transcriptional regulator PadR
VVRQKADLPQGTLDLLVLKALSLGPMYGYGVGQRIQQLAEEMLTVEESQWERLTVAVAKVLRAT